MIEKNALAYVNAFALLGTIPALCREVDEARELIKNEKISLGFKVKGGPSMTLVFKDGECTLVRGTDGCDILLAFSSAEKFNGMIDGTVTPIPRRGLLKVGFLLKRFMPLTDILTRYLRASDEDLANREFFEISTRLMFSVISNALVELANNDTVSRFSASNMVDGTVRLAILGECEARIGIKNHTLSLEDPDSAYSAYMVFPDIDVARALFDGKINAVAAVGLGKVRIGGMICNIDNLNRVLDRVSVYLQ
ncbi:MAG: hypothetical protein IJF38_06410 [Clostridia bacterium]|nr:hypothetical protein [Clostridia bacterium]